MRDTVPEREDGTMGTPTGALADALDAAAESGGGYEELEELGAVRQDDRPSRRRFFALGVSMAAASVAGVRTAAAQQGQPGAKPSATALLMSLG